MSSLYKEAMEQGIQVYEFNFRDQLKGLYLDGAIALAKDLKEEERLCVLAEELGHHYTSYGNITDPASLESAKQEKRARAWAHNRLVPIDKLIEACIVCEGSERWELAQHLGVTDEFLCDTLEAYKARYGLYIEHGDYCLYFDPLTLAHYNY